MLRRDFESVTLAHPFVGAACTRTERAHVRLGGCEIRNARDGRWSGAGASVGETERVQFVMEDEPADAARPRRPRETSPAMPATSNQPAAGSGTGVRLSVPE